VYKVEEGIAVLVDIEALLLPHTNLGASALTDAVVGR
jgi:hypothetical protein